VAQAVIGRIGSTSAESKIFDRIDIVHSSTLVTGLMLKGLVFIAFENQGRDYPLTLENNSMVEIKTK
jgi:hypothetical protein